jgi:hypothetical protein
VVRGSLAPAFRGADPYVPLYGNGTTTQLIALSERI